MINYVIFPGLLLGWISAFSQVEGKMSISRHLFDADPDHKHIKITTNVWYFGHQTIQDVPTLEMTSNSAEKTLKIPVKYYLYIDSASNRHGYFRHFSDTARTIVKSKNSEIILKYGGWDLYSKKKFDYDTMRSLGDTLVNGRNLSRYSFIKVKDKDSFNFIVYASRSDYKQKIWYLLPISKQIGYPVIRMDTYYNGRLTGKIEIEYTASHLTPSERQIFRAWQKHLR